ncbi:MAG TPA: nuclear transport factor 2 family protein [Rhizomicrobium sp.]|nr:nuclear transport factor 2 family protein [Rhizomicrobium sp.]
MKSILLAAATCGVLIAASQPVQAAPAQEPALAPFSQFIDAMNKGDVQTASATFAPSPTIIDEFSPFTWHSFAAWNQDLGADFKAGQVSDFHITLSPVSFKKVDASHGYGVVPSTLTFKVKGKATTEKGMFTFSTVKAAAGWRITGWAWSTL